VKFAALLIALAALGFALVDFVQRTRGLIEKDRVLVAELERVAGEDVARGRARGAPPSTRDVAHARELARAWRQEREQDEAAFFSGAARLSDYLLPVHARPAVDGLAAQRSGLEALLVALPPALKSFAGASPERLGLIVPSLTGGLPDDEARIADQVARATALVRVLAAARPLQNLLADGLAFERRGDELLVKLSGVAPIADAITFYEALLGAADDAPPRRLETFSLRRLPPAEWGTAARRLNAPPVRFELKVGFERVGRADAGAAK
jgi:hypothetical protein